MLGFQIFGVVFFTTRMHYGYFIGCEYGSLFFTLFDNTENAAVHVACASTRLSITIKTMIRFMLRLVRKRRHTLIHFFYSYTAL